VAVHEAHSSLVNVTYWPKAGMTLHDSDVCFQGAFNQSPSLLARADEAIEQVTFLRSMLLLDEKRTPTLSYYGYGSSAA
jgi:hypothetical protein